MGVRSSIVVVSDTPTAAQPVGDTDSHWYSAPELHRPEGRCIHEILTTKESDVYGMGVVILEASSRRPISSDIRANYHIDLLGLDRGRAVPRVQ